MRHKTDVSTAEPDKSAPELTENIIRTRAYQFYEERGYEDGHDLEEDQEGYSVRATVVYFRF